MTDTISTLGFALLGVLARDSLSGYDLALQFKRGLGPFWHARHSQIYPELARLEAAGLVTHERIEQRDRPDKKVFEITGRGVDALSKWVSSPIDVSQIRDELTLRAYSVWLADAARAAALFADQAAQHRAQLAQYEAVRAEMERTCGPRLNQPDSPEFASYATLRRGLLYEAELAEWCGWLANALASHAEQPTPEPASR